MGDNSQDCVTNQVCLLRMDGLGAKIESNCKALDMKFDNHCKVNELQFEQLKEDIATEFKTQTKVVTAAVSAIGVTIMIIDFLLKFMQG